MGWFSDLFGGDGGGDVTQETTAKPPIKLPDYPESEAARINWSDTLKQWQTQPGYGAIQPNWDDIWTNAANKVQRYFMGGPEGPGAVGTVRANLARRNASEDPAAEAVLGRLGMQQGNVLGDMATTQATQQAQLGETGRVNWLNSLMSLAGLKPTYMSGGQIVNTSVAPMSPLQIAGQGVSALFPDSQGQGGLDFGSIMNMFGGAQGGDTGIGDVDATSPMSLFGGSGGGGGSSEGGMFTEEDHWWGELLKIAAAAAGTYYGGPMGGKAAYQGADMAV